MNRLSPLIVRRVGPMAPPPPFAWAADRPQAEPWLSDDLRLFMTGWLGGLVFFGTLFG